MAVANSESDTNTTRNDYDGEVIEIMDTDD